MFEGVVDDHEVVAGRLGFLAPLADQLVVDLGGAQ